MRLLERCGAKRMNWRRERGIQWGRFGGGADPVPTRCRVSEIPQRRVQFLVVGVAAEIVVGMIGPLLVAMAVAQVCRLNRQMAVVVQEKDHPPVQSEGAGRENGNNNGGDGKATGNHLRSS